MEKLARVLMWICVGLSANGAWAAKQKLGCVLIQGPVNLRESPEGKVIRQLPDGVTMFAEEGSDRAHKDWLWVKSFKNKAKEIRCSNDSDAPDAEVSGWLPDSARKDVPLAQLLEIDRLGYLSGWKSASNDYDSPDRATAKVETTCGVFSKTPHGVISSSVTQVFVPGSEIGKECLEGDEVVTCRTPVTGGTDYTVCLASEVETKGARSLGGKDRRKMLEESAVDARSKITAALSPEFIAKVAAKFPSWLPLLVPHPKRNTDYVYDLALLPSAVKAPFSFKDGKSKPRQVLVFFANGEDAAEQAPTLAFEYGTEVEFRKLPLSLAPAKGEHFEDRPSLCLASAGDFVALNSCRVLEDRTELISSLNFRTDPVTEVEEDEMKKALGRLKSGVCCNWNDKKYLQLMPKKE